MERRRDPPDTGRQRILDSLLHSPEGQTIDSLRAGVGLSRNAVYQHVTALERDGLVERASISRTRGRPGQSYRLSEQGAAEFPKHYDRFGDLLLRLIKTKKGSKPLVDLLEELGRSLADDHKASLAGLDTGQRIAAVAELMCDLGYAAEIDAGSAAREDPEGPPQIRAYNCVFHHLAREHEEVCRFDLALLEGLLGGPVEHRECMVRGGTSCRFALLEKAKKGRRKTGIS